MASSTAAVVTGVLTFAAAVVGLAVASSKSSSAAPVTPPKQPTGTAWVRATTINPGDAVRVAIAAADLATLAKTFGTTADLSGLQAILSDPTVAGVLKYGAGAFGSPATVQLWAPADPTLPSDWPADDPAVGAEFHAAFTYNGAAPLTVALSPIPFIAWTRKGIGGVFKGGGFGGGVFGGGGAGGAGMGGGAKTPPLTDTWAPIAPAAQLGAQRWLRMSITPGDLTTFLYQAGASTTGTPAQKAAELQQLLAGAAGVAATTVTVWAPGDPSLPSDWPTETAAATAGNYHAQYQASAAQPVPAWASSSWISLASTAINV